MSFLNAVLNGMISIRKNTFKILSLYPESLDRSALSHYTALQSSGSCSRADILFRDYVTKLLSEQVYDALLYADGLKNSINRDVISQILPESSSLWLNEEGEEISGKNLKDMVRIDKLRSFKAFLYNHIENDDEKRKKAELICSAFNSGNDYVRIEGDVNRLKELSFNDCCRKRSLFSDGPFPLKFGSIVRTGNSGEYKYYMCLQPLCDSVRLSGKERFPFIELEVAPEGKNYSYVVKVGGDYVCLNAHRKPHQALVSFVFKANKSSKDVRTDKEFIFKSTSPDNCEFLWVAELKEKYALALAQSVASSSTRVGMDVFEPLRHQRKSS